MTGDKQAIFWLDKLKQLDLKQNIRIMNVCGGHERSITMAGLRSILPENIELIPGPGCPVCVCPEEDVYQAIQLSLKADIILLAFGDMLRVPANVAKGEVRTLEQAKAQGADVRPVASPLEVITIAEANPQKPVVFFAAGFETTTAPVAAMLLESQPENLSLLLSARLTWPAVAMLLGSETPGFDALIAPGHVSTVMGYNEWQFVPNDFNIPAAVSGFSSASLLAGFYSVIRQKLEEKCFLDNCYAELVKPDGNLRAKAQLNQAFDVVDANWRGVGVIPDSGFGLKPKFKKFDARLRFADFTDKARKHAGNMPQGCDCAQVLLGKIYPNECKLYGKTCVPRNPVGPCMVSDEGACRIWWAGGVR